MVQFLPTSHLSELENNGPSLLPLSRSKRLPRHVFSGLSLSDRFQSIPALFPSHGLGNLPSVNLVGDSMKGLLTVQDYTVHPPISLP